MKLKLLKQNIIPLEYNGSYKGVVYNGEDYAIQIAENSEGIIVDVWIRHGELEETHTYWNWSKPKLKKINKSNNKKHAKLGAKHTKSKGRRKRSSKIQEKSSKQKK